MSSSAVSKFVNSLKDLYNMAKLNGWYLPKEKSSAVNELMIYNVIQGHYWCPKYKDIKKLPCVRAPVKETLYSKIEAICLKKDYNIAWIDPQHMPDKEWMVDVLATLDPDDEIFKKSYVAPPVRKR